MQHTLGKLTNKDGGGSLDFSMNPSELKISRHFDFGVEGCLGQAAPVVSFKSAQPTQLSFQLRFDKDVEKKSDPQTALKFLKELNQIKSDTLSVPLIEFSLGSLTFRGYISHYQVNATRFDDKGDATSAAIDFTMVSNGELEHG